ncbi:sigma-54-dependent response regulator transcription factor AlgB [Pseudomonas leptonychotis]|jgi:NtrC-family two-component system response regulator AlgB|uniref:Alginate biosynthesis transcriptional regulatory protein AlgB n=1 Tax=Pseudomonas leptonychotis TaxID=2448482 RepID=A0A4T2A2Y3_9PSED|nr:sigma-54-dependent response regulator transcription factor AlgB [Pseudomonas leptonychotis]TIH10652.1 sigma-54-dependent Fis family transcriptional regulator [Pseudomonas leptonychotis]
MDTPAQPLGRILLVDDEPAILRTFRYCLEDEGYQVSTATSAAQADALLLRQVFDLCFLDLRLGDDDGLEVLAHMRVQAPWMRVVMITAHSAVDTAVDAIQAGAADYVVKPCSPDQLRLAAAKQLEIRRLAERLEHLEGSVRKPGEGLDSNNPAMMAVLQTAKQVADTDANILILGESGTGKGELAQAIHGWSKRAKKACVTINCPSLSAELMESELFGHNRGSFTGATESTQGRVSQADGGTLFLDEIGDFPLALQPKLLRFIQDKVYERIGDPQTRQADVRILAATNLDLDEMAKNGQFREDLKYRLNVITLTLPALRERREDILVLAERFLARFVSDYARPARAFSDEAREALLNYPWPGNIRELRNVIERASILCPEQQVQVSHLGLNLNEELNSPYVGGEMSLEDLEKAHISAVLANSSTLDQAAKTLGIDASTLYRKRKQLGL